MHLIATKTMLLHMPHAPCPMRPTCRISPPFSPLLQLPVFGWLPCVDLPIGGQQMPPCIDFYNFCVNPFDVPNDRTVFPHALHPPHATSPDSLPPTMLTLGDCCVFLLSFDHVRPRPRPSLYFLMGSVSAFQTKESAVAPPNQITGA